MTKEEAANICGVHPRTITNWDRHSAPIPAMRLLEFYTKDLGIFHPSWRGFTISHTGKLYGPNRLQISAEHLRHYDDLVAELRYWKRRTG